MSSFEYPEARVTVSAQRGVHQVDNGTVLTAQVEALTKMVKDLQKNKEQACEICRGGHDTVDCPISIDSLQEQVDFVSNPNRVQGNTFGNSYNPGWKNQQSWRSGNPPGFQPRTQSLFQNQTSGQSSGMGQGARKPSMEDMMAQLLARDDTRYKEMQERDRVYQMRFQENEAMLKNQGALLQNLERNVGELASMMQERQQGVLPINVVKNPNAHVKAVTTRSGRTTSEVEKHVPYTDDDVDEEIEIEAPAGEVQQRLCPASTAQPAETEKKAAESSQKEPQIRLDRLPYPGRVAQHRNEEQYGKFLEMFKQLKVNLPFVEALQHMPKYAKFLKDLLTNKKKLEQISTVILSEECSAVLQNKLPPKRADPGSFTIPCFIGNLSVSNALADLGASINLMPYSVFAKLDLGEPVPMRMSIQLADRSVKYPRGIVENMLVKVDRFVFPIDFVILDMDRGVNEPSYS
ncbi:hypothetical protein QVD17_07278 [Tagetes erecta]|uniref:Uncharacterized protein n=1 Tax=Tagetes erecta TaxID=13708 RepID=A0AAD8PCI5_TARER|nr:hypothetical protein QVD17_07278 [Tagetes erecta]